MTTNGFDKGYKFIKVVESFTLDGIRCGLVQFAEEEELELITFSVINEKILKMVST